MFVTVHFLSELLVKFLLVCFSLLEVKQVLVLSQEKIVLRIL